MSRPCGVPTCEHKDVGLCPDVAQPVCAAMTLASRRPYWWLLLYLRAEFY